MNETGEAADGSIAQWTSIGLSAAIVVTTALTLGSWSPRALGKSDNEAMESPLMLSVARQLVYSPAELYGPFGRTNPLVLIHAPLYYRAAALLAWPMVRMGIDPVDAARISGRLLSFAGLIATTVAVGRLARLGGLPRHAGWWAMGLVVSAPVLSGIPYAVRPDLLGVAFQTWAVALAAASLASVGTTRGAAWRMVIASALFGLAVCVKQHLVAAWAVTVVWVAVSWLRGRAAVRPVLLVTVPGLVVAGSIYATEWRVTGGRIWDATFVAASSIGRVHPGSWDTVALLLLGILERSAGLVTLLVAAPAVTLAARSTVLRAVVAAVGTLAISLVLIAYVNHALTSSASPDKGRTGALITICVGVCAIVAVGETFFCRDRRPESTVRAAPLGWYIAVELAFVVILSRQSTGAWLNYAIPATVFAAVVAGRGLSGLTQRPVPRWVAVPVGLAATMLVISCIGSLSEDRWRARREGRFVEEILTHRSLDRSSYYFTNRPGINRLNGRLELVHDDWLYPVFEKIGLAEPRSTWLRIALGQHGPVRAVVATSPDQHIEGTSLDLLRLGYRRDISDGPFYVWIR